MSEERNLGELPEARVSSFKMVLGLTGVIVGLGVLFCGGVAGYVAWRTPDQQVDSKAALKKDPALIREILQSIVLIDMPDGFKPFAGEDRTFMKVCFGRDPGDGALLKIGRVEFTQMLPGDDPRGRIPMMMHVLEMGDPDTSTLLNPGGDSPETTRELTVLGQPYPFRFTRGTQGDRNVPVVKATGGFMTNEEIVILSCTLPAAEFDEQAIVRIIESIRHPRGETAVSPDSFKRDPGVAPQSGAKRKSPTIDSSAADAPIKAPETAEPPNATPEKP